MSRRPTLENLPAYIERVYSKKHGAVVRIETGNNLIGKDAFRKFHFANGKYVTYCRDVFDTWFRHDGGGRYGPQSLYKNL